MNGYVANARDLREEFDSTELMLETLRPHSRKAKCKFDEKNEAPYHFGLMNALSFLTIAVVSICNIAMNFLVRRAAENANTYRQALGSSSFWLALIAGTISILSMVQLYRSKINLAQGVLIMGAMSILGGSLLGMLIGNKLSRTEALLLVTLTTLFVYRWLGK